MINNAKGQASFFAMFQLVIGLVLIVAFLPVINTLVFQANNSNMEALSFVDIIKLLIGLSGLLMVLLFIMGVVGDFQQKQQGY